MAAANLRSGQMFTDLDPLRLGILLCGALIAGFTTGFAGFGTGLVSSGLWFYVLPAPMVPPLVVLASLAAQLVGMMTVRKAFEWRRALPYMIGGALGVPLGVMALRAASPDLLRSCVGGFLVVYALSQLCGLARVTIGPRGGWPASSTVGVGGGFLGGFAGLSGPLPLIWLQLQGGPVDRQRAVYQPFNMVVLGLAGVGMIIGGQLAGDVWYVASLCLPVTLFGAWIGARVYTGVSLETFRRVVLALLLVSGSILVGQAMFRSAD